MSHEHTMKRREGILRSSLSISTVIVYALVEQEVVLGGPGVDVSEAEEAVLSVDEG